MFFKRQNCANHIFLLLFVFSFVEAAGDVLINYKQYIDNVVEQMVSCMEDKEMVDKNFPIDDCESQINATYYGQSAIGKVEFRSGFVVSIESAKGLEIPNRDICSETECSMEADFKLLGVNIVYDVHYELEGNKNGDATFLLRHDDVCFTLRIFRKHNAEVESSVEYRSVNTAGRGAWQTSVKTHPNTPQVQIIARTLRGNWTFRHPLMLSYPKWNVSLKKCLNKAIPKFAFPEIDYLK